MGKLYSDTRRSSCPENAYKFRTAAPPAGSTLARPSPEAPKTTPGNTHKSPRLLEAGPHVHVSACGRRPLAAATLRLDRWQGGERMMASANSASWKAAMEATNLVRANAAAVTACHQKAVRTGKPQPCVLRVDPAGA
jgi:hypothetical protein